MHRTQLSGLDVLQSELLLSFPGLRHAFFLKNDNCNVSYSVGDDANRVDRNRKRVFDAFGIRSYQGVACCHTTNIILVTAREAQLYLQADGLLTTLPNQALATTCADCQCAIFYDPVTRQLANIHAGWRGQAGGIYSGTIQKMLKAGARAENICVAVFPSLGPEYAEFVHYEKELPKRWWPHKYSQSRFNLWDLAEKEFLANGLKQANIDIARICTYSSSDCFSYRRDKPSGRHMTLCSLSET